MRFHARLKGSSSTEIVANNPVDAERTLAKELARALPGAELDVREIHRTDPEPRIAENFRLVYSLTTGIEVEADDEESARTAAYRTARRALEGTRFARVPWDRAIVRELPSV